ncbi:MAG: adenylyltransferase/cytidyltransferase family protein [Patescibacteria group bacterium]
MKKPTVLVFGTFDRLHPGHLNFLKQAARYGNVTVVVARDNNVKLVKKHRPIERERRRLNQLNRLSIVKQALLGNKKYTDRYKVLNKIKPNVICLGYDQRETLANLRKYLRKVGLLAKVIRLKSHKPRRYKSSLAKKNR